MVTSDLTTSLLYDRNGSTTSVQLPAGTLTTYLWDAADRLAATQLPNGNRYSETYRFDDLRIAQSGPNGRQTFTWAQNEVLAERGTTAGVAWSELFTHGPTDGPNLLRALGTDHTGASLQRHFHLDALGSVQAITGSAQAVETAYQTDAWGNVSAGSAADNPAVYLGGLGYWSEPDQALSYVRARWLNSATGSWLSVDPVASEPRYLYVGQRPTAQVDPSGTQAEKPNVRWVKAILGDPDSVTIEDIRRIQKILPANRRAPSWALEGAGSLPFQTYSDYIAWIRPYLDDYANGEPPPGITYDYFSSDLGPPEFRIVHGPDGIRYGEWLRNGVVTRRIEDQPTLMRSSTKAQNAWDAVWGTVRTVNPLNLRPQRTFEPQIPSSLFDPDVEWTEQSLTVQSDKPTSAFFDALRRFTGYTNPLPHPAVSRLGQYVTFHFTGWEAHAQDDLDVQVIKYDPQHHVFAIQTLSGHILRGWRYWKVEREGNSVTLTTGSIDKLENSVTGGIKQNFPWVLGINLGRTVMFEGWKRMLFASARKADPHLRFVGDYDKATIPKVHDLKDRPLPPGYRNVLQLLIHGSVGGPPTPVRANAVPRARLAPPLPDKHSVEADLQLMEWLKTHPRF